MNEFTLSDRCGSGSGRWGWNWHCRQLHETGLSIPVMEHGKFYHIKHQESRTRRDQEDLKSQNCQAQTVTDLQLTKCSKWQELEGEFLNF